MSGQSLWEIHDQLERVVLEYTDAETGEMLDGFEEAVEALSLTREQKILAMGRWLMGEKAEGDMVQEQANRLTDRAATHRRRFDRGKSYLAAVMEPGEKYKDEVVTVRAQRNPESVWVPDDADPQVWAADAKFERFARIRFEVDRAELKAALKEGREVPKGVGLVRGHHVRVL